MTIVANFDVAYVTVQRLSVHCGACPDRFWHSGLEQDEVLEVYLFLGVVRCFIEINHYVC